MKPISLAKPLIIMVVGLPGAGKTFFARQFSETFGAPLISFDRVHFEISKESLQGGSTYGLAQRIIAYEIEEFTKTKRTFIIDGGLSSKTERLAVRKFAAKYGYDTIAVWVQTDVATCQQRAIKRNKAKTDDKYSQPLTPETFQLLAKKLSPPSVQENYIVISGKHTYSTQVKAVLRKLALPREGQPSREHTPPTRTISVTNGGPSQPPHDPPPQRRSVTIT